MFLNAASHDCMKDCYKSYEYNKSNVGSLEVKMQNEQLHIVFRHLTLLTFYDISKGFM